MQNQSSVCSCRIFLLTVLLLADAVYLIINLANLSTENSRIERIQNGYYCRDVCEAYPYEINSGICNKYDWSSSDWIYKSTCKDNELYKHEDAYSTIKGWTIACSVLLILLICWVRSDCRRLRSRNRSMSLYEQPIILNQERLINQSDQE